MNRELPNAVAEIPVADKDRALRYYEERLGFGVDWGRGGIGIAGISRGQCRLFLTTPDFREYFGNWGPVVIWLNLDSTAEVDALHDEWRARGATIRQPPESKEWSRLHEFVATDPDGNVVRVFYNF